MEVEDEVEVEEPVEHEDPEVWGTIGYLNSLLNTPEHENSRGMIRELVGEEVFDKVVSGNYKKDDIKHFYSTLSQWPYKGAIQESDRKNGTDIWKMIESIYRMVVLDELG